MAVKMVKRTANELKREVESEAEKLARQKRARADLADAVVKGREQKQIRSEDARRKILLGAYLLKQHDNNIGGFLEKHPDFLLFIRENEKHLFV